MLVLAIHACAARRNPPSEKGKKDTDKDGNHVAKLNMEEAWWLGVTSTPTNQWLSRDSSGAVISSHWEADLTDDEVVDLTEAGRRETSSWEESTAFRELSIAQGKFKVCRV